MTQQQQEQHITPGKEYRIPGWILKKKKDIWIKETKYMVINTGKEPEEAIVERVKEGIVQETDIYKYLRMVINKSGNLS